jgi:glycolate oxidase FAD binding subunit
LPAVLYPTSERELQDALAQAASARRHITLHGNNTKSLMAGAPAAADVTISTARLNRILQYEPRDLTISVQAGMPFAELSRELARHNQMIPLDGPYAESATVGGMVAANISGARRRLYGTARDLVIGMSFATLEGKLVRTGGMVVKNVAGLDMGKLLIGSYGTLAAIASINFKLIPIPRQTRTALIPFDDARSALAARDATLSGVLTPAAADILNPILAAQLGPPLSLKGFVLALQFAGNEAVIERSIRETQALGSARILTGADESRFWHTLDDLTPHHLQKFPQGVVARISTTLADLAPALASTNVPLRAHAATGLIRAWFTRPEDAARWLKSSGQRGWEGVIEFATAAARPGLILWPAPGGDFEIMKRVKNMFDPEGLLNSGRLYGLL